MKAATARTGRDSFPHNGTAAGLADPLNEGSTGRGAHCGRRKGGALSAFKDSRLNAHVARRVRKIPKGRRCAAMLAAAYMRRIGPIGLKDNAAAAKYRNGLLRAELFVQGRRFG
jgi:hypothetical protein